MTIATSFFTSHPPRDFAYLLSLLFPTLLWLLFRPIPLVPSSWRGSPTAGAYVCCLVVLSFVTVLGAKFNTRLQGSQR